MSPAISREFRFWSLLRFALPSIAMMIFMSLYSIVDGIFISRFIGTDALSATNIVYPVVNVIMAVAIMLATGGSAIVARKLGAQDDDGARRSFSLIVLAGVTAGVVLSAAGAAFLTPICRMLGSSDKLLADCQSYLLIMLLFAPACVLQMLFQTFFVAAGRPGLGLGLTVAAGVANGVLDYVFIVPLGMGVAGAALATAAGFLLPAVAGVVYFFRAGKKGEALYFVRPRAEWGVLAESCLNGSSEMVTNLSGGVITYLFNAIMMHFLGEDGVAAITIVLYAQFLLTALYLGFSTGVAPVISYHYGAENRVQLRRIFRICMTFILASSVLVYAFSLLASDTLVTVFAPAGTAVHDISLDGFLLFSLSFLFAGTNVFASAMFTALSNGRVSAAISFLRTFVFLMAGLLVLPNVFAENGVWISVPLAELLTLLVSIYFLCRVRREQLCA